MECFIEGGRAARTREFEAGRVRRFAKGSGLPLKVSVVDMIEIGAGGGSIASIDSMGLLKVGPRSAGSVPGPVAYGRGGQEPTVTDADLMLGYLNPAYFLGGEMALGPRAVQAALSERLATPLALPLMEVALGIHRVVNENMAAATRRYLAEKGKDVRDYAMVAFGGAGPVHAYALAKLLKISQVVVPFAAGVTSALGFLVAPPATDDVRSYVTRLDALDWGSVKALYDDMEAIARNRLTEAGADPDQVVFNRHADMRYVGQGFEIEVPVAPEAIAEESIESLRESFYATYHRLFERSVRDVAIETLSWRLSAHAPPSSVPLSFPRAQTEDAGTRGARELTFPAFGAVRAAVWDRYTLQTGERIVGPAVIEERESTTVMGPDATAVVDEHLNLIIAIDQ
ncbi:MAG: hydantoinase/oxoprolinase family protein [Pseudomonadota bacterium]